MHRKRLTMVLTLFGVCCLCLAGLLLGVATGPAAGQVKAHAGAKVTIVTVTAGKPSELAFKLSRSSIPSGTVTFKVTNKGAVAHDFEICSSPSSGAAKSCKGTTTKMLKPGKSATLTVTLKKTGKYEYLCRVPGHAGAGMKGVIGVGVKVATPAPTPTPTPTPTPKPGGAAATCSNPTATTVTAEEFDFGFKLSQTTVPCGPVTFNQTNTGGTAHDFAINGVNPAGAVINTGQNTTNTWTLAPGTYGYICDIPTHQQLGMAGTLTVTG
jgi:uncharacterized cupredoxin-like copper-binding protein